MPEDLPKLLTLVTVAQALSVSSHTVRSFVRSGRLKPTRICRRLLFDSCEVAGFLAASRTTLHVASTEHAEVAGVQPGTPSRT